MVGSTQEKMISPVRQIWLFLKRISLYPSEILTKVDPQNQNGSEMVLYPIS